MNSRAFDVLTIGSWLFVLCLSALLIGCQIGHGLGPDPKLPAGKGQIAGTVTFVNDWPDSVAEVRVVVYAEYPPLNYYALSGWSDPIPIGISTYEYRIVLDPGPYGWIIVVWRAEDAFWSFDSLAGTYYAYGDTTRPGRVSVSAGETVRDVDVVATF